MRLVITGTPGTGKTTLAEAISNSLELPLIQANEFAKEKDLVESDGSVDVDRLRELILEKISKMRGFVAEGHLLCEFQIPADRCVVLRCNPKQLEGRLKARGYSGEKLRDNIECEALDYCLVNAEENYGCVTQLDNTLPLTAQKALKQLNSSDKVRWSLDDFGQKA